MSTPTETGDGLQKVENAEISEKQVQGGERGGNRARRYRQLKKGLI